MGSNLRREREWGFFNLLFVGGAALVVEDLEVDVMAVLLEAGHDTVGGG